MVKICRLIVAYCVLEFDSHLIDKFAGVLANINVAEDHKIMVTVGQLGILRLQVSNEIINL